MQHDGGLRVGPHLHDDVFARLRAVAAARDGDALAELCVLCHLNQRAANGLLGCDGGNPVDRCLGSQVAGFVRGELGDGDAFGNVGFPLQRGRFGLLVEQRLDASHG